HLEVNNDSFNAMTIAGSVTVQGSTFHSALTHTGSDESVFELFTSNTGNLSVLGSVFASQSSSGSGDERNQAFTLNARNLHVFGSVTELLAGPGTGFQGNSVDTEGTGSLTVGLGVTQSATGGTGLFPPDQDGAENSVETNADGAIFGGSISIGGGVSQTSSASSGGGEEGQTKENGATLNIPPAGTQKATRPDRK